MLIQTGTAVDPETGAVVTSGGRVLAVSSYGEDIAGALANSFASVGKINFDGAYYRRDIGRDLIALQEK